MSYPNNYNPHNAAGTPTSAPTQAWFFKNNLQPDGVGNNTAIDDAMLNLNSVLRGTAPTRNIQVDEPLHITSTDPLQVKKQGEGFVSHWKITNKEGKKSKNNYQTLVVPPMQPNQSVSTQPQTPQSAPPHFPSFGSMTNAYQQHFDDYSPRARNSQYLYDSPNTPTTYHQQQPSTPHQQIQTPQQPSTPNQAQAQPPPQPQQHAIPQPYIEYSFVSHNSKGKRGRRKKSVTIMSTQNPFAGTFVDSSPVTSSPRQFTNVPNATFTNYTPNATPGIAKKTRMKPSVPRISVRTTNENTSPVMTATTTEDVIVVSQLDRTPNTGNTSSMSTSSEHVFTPLFTLPPMLSEPTASSSVSNISSSNETDEQDSNSKYNHNKLRRVSIKNLLC
jgi:hypothetical protein